MNSINVISPYKYRGQWVFDDPDKGLKKEPFVAGIDVIIDFKVKGIPRAKKGFNVLFSDSEFPGYDTVLTWVGAFGDGNWYVDRDTKLMGWLCPALLKYYEAAPRKIYLQIKAKGN